MQILKGIVEVNEEEDGLEQKLSSSSFMSEIFEITLRTLERLFHLSQVHSGPHYGLL